MSLPQLFNGISLQSHDLQVPSGLQGPSLGAETLFLSLGSVAFWEFLDNHAPLLMPIERNKGKCSSLLQHNHDNRNYGVSVEYQGRGEVPAPLEFGQPVAPSLKLFE